MAAISIPRDLLLIHQQKEKACPKSLGAFHSPLKLLPFKTPGLSLSVCFNSGEKQK